MIPVDFRIPRASITGMSEADICWAVVEPVWPTAEIETDRELDHIARATRGQRAVYCTMLYAREVDNGGVKQFLSHSSGLYSRCVLDGLELLSANELHDAFGLVMTYSPGGQAPIDWEQRRKELKRVSADQWAVIKKHEDEVYANGGFEASLTPHWMRYIAEHPEDFFV